MRWKTPQPVTQKLGLFYLLDLEVFLKYLSTRRETLEQCVQLLSIIRYIIWSQSNYKADKEESWQRSELGRRGVFVSH